MNKRIGGVLLLFVHAVGWGSSVVEWVALKNWPVRPAFDQADEHRLVQVALYRLTEPPIGPKRLVLPSALEFQLRPMQVRPLG